jgi:hypothetical protein
VSWGKLACGVKLEDGTCATGSSVLNSADAGGYDDVRRGDLATTTCGMYDPPTVGMWRATRLD